MNNEIVNQKWLFDAELVLKYCWHDGNHLALQCVWPDYDSGQILMWAAHCHRFVSISLFSHVDYWMLVCWWWWFNWSFAPLTAPVVTTTSSSNKHRLTQVHLENGR